MKKFKIIMSMFIVISIFVSMFQVFAIESQIKLDEDYLKNERQGLKIYNDLLTHFRNESELKKANTSSSTSNETDVFPSAYGGVYTDPETGKLVICITDGTDSRSFQRDIASISKQFDDNSVVYRSVTYSYNKIIEVTEEILPGFCKNNPEIIDGYYTRFTENQIVIQLFDHTEENETLILDYINLMLGENVRTLIHFEESNNQFEEETTITAGQSVKLHTVGEDGTGWYNYSVGFRAKKIVGNEIIYGFVTAAHGVPEALGNTWKYGVRVIGYTYSYAYQSNVDAAFVELESPHTISTEIAGYQKNYWPNGYYNITENARVFCSGAATLSNSLSGNLVAGQVISTNCSSASSGFSDMILATYDSIEGDSGGLVFYNSGESEVYVVGIHKGSYNSNALSSKAGNILRVLGLGMWY